MKTLDEVIKANECCDHGEPDSRCEDCPYNGIGACCAERETDALHYLREYREKHDEILRMEEALGYCEIMANPPLTWDELRTMTGKPVWLEHPKTGEAHWAIIGNWYDESEMRLFLAEDENTYYVSRELYEEGILQAYRKERS